MADTNFVILVSDSLKRQLERLRRPELERLREKFEFLSSGLWEGGLRVKKLKGSPAVVFEARVSKGDRLLFTLGREAGESRLYAWGIESHDDVNRAKASLQPGNAPFLSFEPIGIEEKSDLDLETLDPACFTQEPFEAVAAEDCGPQRWRALENGDWDRLLASARGAEIDLRLFLTQAQRSVLASPPPLLLSGTAGSGKTTIAVYYLFRDLPGVERRLFLTWHPFLCAYSERLYDGLAAGRPGPAPLRPRFAPWRDVVLEIVAGASGRPAKSFEAEREVDLPWFERSLRERKEFAELDPELAWEEIRGIIKGAKPSLDLRRIAQLIAALEDGSLSGRDRRELGELIQAVENLDFLPRIEAIIDRRRVFADYGDFMRSFASPAFSERAEALIVFRQILEQLEKRKAEVGRSLLSFPEYQALGKKRAPRFASDRATIYAVAEWYEDSLRSLGLWDDIDLARHALAVLDAESSRGGHRFEPWDLVVCDEAQDFADAHFQLMFRLASDPRNVVMAGDVKQTINPSGFRWSALRGFFWERGIAPPELFRLDLNFRSVGGIVALGNALLDLKKRLAGIQSDESKERWKFLGLMPCLLTGVEAAALAPAVPSGGAANAIIVRDGAARELVKALVGSEFVFTISEAKGLEFDATLLWNLTPATGEIAGLWRRVAADGKAALGSEARIAHEISLYYVAATRARNGLVIYESNGDFWGLEEFAGLLVPSGEKESVAAYWTSLSTPAEWRERGDYYAERKHWMAAAECYRNAGDEAAELRARALGLLAARRFAEAAPLLETAGLAKQAAEAWETAGDFGKALGLWSALGLASRAQRCEALGLEKKGSYAAAAALWLKLKDKASAARALSRAELDPSAGELYRALKLWDKAAACFAKAGRHREAAECQRKLGNQGKAADAYLAAGDLDAAIRYYRLAREYKKESACIEKLGRFDILAKRQIAARDAESAIHSWRRWLEKDGDARRAALLAEANSLVKKKAFEAAARFSALGERSRALELFKKSGYWESALAETLALGDHLEAAECLWRLRRYAEAARERELAGKHDATTVDFFRLSVDGPKYGEPDRKKAQAMNDEAESFDAKGDYQRALNRYQAIGHVDAALPLFKRLDRDDEAFDFLGRYDSFDELETLIRAKPTFKLSHKFFARPSIELKSYYYGKNTSSAKLLMLTVVARHSGGTETVGEDTVKELDTLLPLRLDMTYAMIAEEKRFDLIDFLLRIGHINALYLVWRFSRVYGEKVAEFIETLVERAEKAAETDAPLSPWCGGLLKAMGRSAKPSILPKSELSDWRTVPYWFGSETPFDVLDWYREPGREDDHNSFVRLLGIEASAGLHAERHGDFATAAAWFAAAKRWPEALNAYRRAGDAIGTARALEKTGALRESLDLWNKLGRSKDSARVQKSIAAGKGGPGPKGGPCPMGDGGQLFLL